MAPVSSYSHPISAIKTYLSDTLKRAPTSTGISGTASTVVKKATELISRDNQVDYGSGVTDPHKIPNKAFFALFALIGVGIIITAIWFFFWAKNGGIYYTEHDWEDYKSTVLRRKGPNGTTLSGATESTDLGGGSIVHGENRSIWGRKKKAKKAKKFKDFDEESSSLSGSQVTSEMTEAPYRDDATAPSIRGHKKKKSRPHTPRDPEYDEELDIGVQEAIRAYRHEKPARVGGINKQSESSTWDGSNTQGSDASTDLLSNRQVTPTTTPTKRHKERNDNYTGGSGGIRKVMPSTSEKPSASQERIRSESRRLQEKGRTARRDFSFRVGDDSVADPQESRPLTSTPQSDSRGERQTERRARRQSPTKRVPGTYAASDVATSVSGESSDLGTKSYHHPIPGLSSAAGSDYAGEKRKKRAGAGGGGYRRGRGNDIDD